MRREPADPGQEKIDVRRDFLMPEHGAATQVWAAVSKELADVGIRVPRGLPDPRGRRTYAVDEAHAAALWDLSEKLCDSGFQP